MAHTYATVAEANDYLTSGGSTKFATESAAIVALKLSILESVSRRIDYVCHRSSFGSGFGPRIGINLYDGDGCSDLHLRDDLLSVSAFTVAPATAGTGVAVVVNDDYYLANADGYTGPPWRKVILHGQGSPTAFGPGLRTVSITGTWGHSNVTVPLSPTTAEALDSSETDVDLSAATGISPGATLLVDSEQLYVRSFADADTITVVRGANGTTAATHLTAASLARYSYDARVRDVCLRLFQRRWKARDAGADGTDGGMDVPSQQAREGEDLIIRRGLSDLLMLGTY